MTRLGVALLRTDIRVPGAKLPLMSVSQVHGVIRRDELTDKPARAETLDNYKVVRKGEIAFNKMSIRAGALGVSPEDGLVTYHYEVMKARPQHHAQYLVYLMKSSWFISELVRRERGIGSGEQANVRTTEVPFRVLKTIDVFLPPLRVQRAISDYLDRETALTDALIEKQNAFVQRLRERRRGVISSAVIAGIRGEAPAAASGSWFPMVNPRYPLRRLHYAYEVTLGKMLDAGKWESSAPGTVPYLRAANVQSSGLQLDDLKEMPFSDQEMERLDLRAGDVLVVEGGSVGVSYRLAQDMPGIGFQKTLNRVRGRAGQPTEYLWYVFQHLRATGVFDLIASGSTFAHLTSEKLRSIKVPAPSPTEQREIAKYLDHETAMIDALIAKVQRHIELAKERRSALITAAVTGQIDAGRV